MNLVPLIEKKKRGEPLSEHEIRSWIDAYVNEETPDYQVAALLMAICFKGMNAQECAALCEAMTFSGDVNDLSKIPGRIADKHSTGGVGDKTSLVLGPMVAACGGTVAKMSGRGLGHTGGTLDKLESIAGFQIQQSKEAFLKQVKDIHLAIIGQSDNMVPADKKLYALRDVTGTVDSIPLIASSIMSKKLASGADVIVLDVKYGDGAFMKTAEDAQQLAKTMIAIGEACNRRMCALITDMNQPLGKMIGNALEVKEAIETLQGRGPEDLKTLCIECAARMLSLSDICSLEEARIKAAASLQDGSALQKLIEMVTYQGGNPEQIRNPETLPAASCQSILTAKQSGYIHAMKSQQLGICAMKLKAGRERKEDTIDHSTGLQLFVKNGDYINAGDALAVVHHNEALQEDWLNELNDCFIIRDEEPKKQPFIYKIL